MKSQGPFSVPIPVGKTKLKKPADAQIIAGLFQLPVTAATRLLLVDQDSSIQIERGDKTR